MCLHMQDSDGDGKSYLVEYGREAGGPIFCWEVTGKGYDFRCFTRLSLALARSHCPVMALADLQFSARMELLDDDIPVLDSQLACTDALLIPVHFRHF
jgi:hypothetical protein